MKRWNAFLLVSLLLLPLLILPSCGGKPNSGERRAQAMLEYLVSYGVPHHRMSTASYGEEWPLDRKGPVSAARRRRIERPAPPIKDRAPVSVPLQTGLKVPGACAPAVGYRRGIERRGPRDDYRNRAKIHC